MYKKNTPNWHCGWRDFQVPKENLQNWVENNPGFLIDAQTKAEKTTLNVKWLLNS